MHPEVSVIVPVYNVEAYLEKCLDSLVNQSLERLEIIVVNDGSQDHSQKIIDSYVTRFPNKVKAFYKENGGLSDARNFGLDRCSGYYIGFVDSDDSVDAEMFAEMYRLAKEKTADLVICNLQKVNELGEVTQKLTQIPNMETSFLLKEHFSVFSDLSYFACNKLFKAELFINKRFKKGIHFEDIQLIPQVLLDCKNIAQTQSYFYHYLERSDSISKTHTLKGLDILSAVKDVECYFETTNYSGFKKELKGFHILEGVYSFLAYVAFVQDKEVYLKMQSELRVFLRERRISVRDLLSYRRFGKNYFMSLSISKRVYYLIQFFVPVKFQFRILARFLS